MVEGMHQLSRKATLLYPIAQTWSRQVPGLQRMLMWKQRLNYWARKLKSSWAKDVDESARLVIVEENCRIK